MVTDKEFLAFDDGIFKPYFERFIEFKRGNGEKVAHSTLIRLKTLNSALNECSDTLELDQNTVELLLQPRDREQPTLRAMRVSDLRQFNAFLHALGIPVYQISRRYMKTPSVSFKPYVFSWDELLRVVEVADQLEPSPRSRQCHKVYPVLARILIGTGLRIGEALSLRRKDVDIGNQLLIVQRSKNQVSRYVPMSTSLSEAVLDYLSCSPQEHDPEQYLFASPYTGTHYSHCAMRYMFKRIFKEAGIRTQSGKLPRIHDIRHSFCTITLDRLLSSGMDQYVAIPLLAAYVGHVNLADTERYVHLTEHGYDQFMLAQNQLGELIPEVETYEE